MSRVECYRNHDGSEWSFIAEQFRSNHPDVIVDVDGLPMTLVMEFDDTPDMAMLDIDEVTATSNQFNVKGSSDIQMMICRAVSAALVTAFDAGVEHERGEEKTSPLAWLGSSDC